MDEKKYRNPALTVDAIIEMEDGIVLIKRKNEPYGWALPGGFVDYGETLEDAVEREVLEETGVSLTSVVQFHAYSDPARDPRQHTVSVVYIATPVFGQHPIGADDALRAKVFPLDALPAVIAFDHGRIIEDYKKHLKIN